MHRIILGVLCALAIVCLMVIAALSARAQAFCGPQSEMIKALTDGRYREVPRFHGETRGMPVTVFANPETGTWSLLVIRPDGAACLVIGGTGFQEAPPAPKGEPT